MMNETDSQSDSINEQKPLSLDQQQQHEEKIAVDSHASSSGDVSEGPNLANNAEMMNQTDSDSQSDSIIEEEPLTPYRRQNLPKMDLVEVDHFHKGPRWDYLQIGAPLYQASVKGDWEAAKAILNKYPELELVRYSITGNGETSLHVAASTKSSKKVEKFVENLVKLMTEEDLELENKQHRTALYLAAECGNIKTVKTMMEKNKNLHTIPGGLPEYGFQNPDIMPLSTAVLFGNYEVVKYLYEKSKDLSDGNGWTHQMRDQFLEKCVQGDMFDIALKVVLDYPLLGSRALEVMAQKPEAFQEERSNITERIIKIGFSVIGSKAGTLEKEPKALQVLQVILYDIAERHKLEIDYIIRGPAIFRGPSEWKLHDKPDQDPTRFRSPFWTLFVAAELGNTKFVVEFIRQFPDLIWKVNDDGHTIFHTAVKHRREGIYNLLYGIGSMKNLITPMKDKDGNNMFHLAAKSTKKKRLEDVSGAALQIQRELLWFKEVESIMPPAYRLRKNKDGLTPYELFTEEHQHLMIQGEEWMKSTASQCMVVATLIATIVFASAFTVPGGYNQNSGIPMFNRKVTFVVFVVADAISLFLSTASILTFLSILTSRYAEHAERDFVRSLPMRFMLGLSTLFLSITTMMITFGVSFFVLYHNEMRWIPISIGVFAIMPVVLYAVLQYHLLIDVIRATYGSKNLFKPKYQFRWLYENPRI